MVFYGVYCISLYLLYSLGILWYFRVFCGILIVSILWYSMVIHCIFMLFMVFYCILMVFPGYLHGISKVFMVFIVFQGILRYLLYSIVIYCISTVSSWYPYGILW